MAKRQYKVSDEIPVAIPPESSTEKTQAPVLKKEETEAEMIARIKARNGDDDEYVDKYHKDFPY
jgi:hypothetical protein